MATKRCTEADRRGRLAKARQFLEAAELVEAFADEDDLPDALVTLCVHAGHQDALTSKRGSSVTRAFAESG